MGHFPVEVGKPIQAGWGASLDDTGHYLPTLTATGDQPVLGEDGFLTGKWWRTGPLINVSVDLFITTLSGDPAGVIQGTSWRIGLPFEVDEGFHVVGVLNSSGGSDIVGNFHARTNPAGESKAGAVILATSSRMIFYSHGFTTSLGSQHMGTTIRVKAKVSYVALPSALPD